MHILDISLDVDFLNFSLQNFKVEFLLPQKHGKRIQIFFSLSASTQEAPSKSFLLYFPTHGQAQTVWNKSGLDWQSCQRVEKEQKIIPYFIDR